MSTIFISYRRDDSGMGVGRIYDRLVDAFGEDSVFKDVDNIPPGSDFPAVLRDAVARCSVMLVVIGRSWLTIEDKSGRRRLDNPDDYVRIEVRSALQRADCIVIPVLVDDAAMPGADALPDDLRPLVFRNATRVRNDPDFHRDVNGLIAELRSYLPDSPPPGDIPAAIERFYIAVDGERWDEAEKLLAQIEASGRVPTLFDVAAWKQQIADGQTRSDNYAVIRAIARLPKLTVERKREGWRMLQAFWTRYPGYDPDDLAQRLRPSAEELLPAPFAWVEIPGGRGTMRTNELGVTLNIPTERYWIGRYPITNAQFARFIEAGGYAEPRWWTQAGWAALKKNGWTEPRYWTDGRLNGPEQPVVGVSWYEAVALCRWLSEVTGERIALPTEAQWQYAAQGGDGRAYPWGNGWHGARCNNSVALRYSDRTTPVRAYEGKGDSPFGVVDLAGNVLEWCLTGYADRSDDVNSASADRVVRGGSWGIEGVDRFRCGYRDWDDPDIRLDHVGFRVSRSSF